jgi:hypothetical protein
VRAVGFGEKVRGGVYIEVRSIYPPWPTTASHTEPLRPPEGS